MLNNVISIFGTSAAAGGAGDYESIATVTVGSGGSASISFSSIPSTYKHLQVRAIGRTDRANTYDSLRLNFNSDTNTNYVYHNLYGDGASAGASAGTGSAGITVGYFAGDSATSNIFGTTVIDILDYTNTNKFTTSRHLCGQDNNGSGYIFFSSGLWRDTAAISTLTLTPFIGTTFKQYSSFALYGVKG